MKRGMNEYQFVVVEMHKKVERENAVVGWLVQYSTLI